MVHTCLGEKGYSYGIVTMPSLMFNDFGGTGSELVHMWVQIASVHTNDKKEQEGLAQVSFIPVASCCELKDITRNMWMEARCCWMPFQPLFTSADTKKGANRSSLMVNGLISSDLGKGGLCNNYTCDKPSCKALRDKALLFKRDDLTRVNDAENKGTSICIYSYGLYIV